MFLIKHFVNLLFSQPPVSPNGEAAAGLLLACSLDVIFKTLRRTPPSRRSKEDATIEGNGNGQVPPGQHEDENGNIVNNGGNMAPGLNRGDKIDKPDNPNKPDKPENPGTEDKDNKKANGKPALLFWDAAETIICGRAFRFVQRSDHIL